MRRKINAVICGVLTFGAIAVCCHGGTPTPSPFDASKVDFSTMPDAEAQIQATIAHRNALHQQLLNDVLPAASDNVKAAVDKAQDLQKQIDAMAIQAARVPVLEAELAKAHKACWRNLFIGAVVGVIGALVGPKLLGLAAFLGG